MTEAEQRDQLRSHIRDKRRQMESFLAVASPRKRRLLNATLGGGLLASVLTAIPAVGGPAVTTWLSQAVGAGAESPSWRLLCGAAALSSLVATVATQLLKSQNLEEFVNRAQSCRAKLEAMDAALALGHLDARQATAEYLRVVESAAFLDPA